MLSVLTKNRLKSCGFLLMLVGCGGFNKPSDRHSKSVFAIIGANDYAHQNERFNRFSSLVDKVHVFASHHESIASLQAHKHVVDLKDLPASLTQALLEDNPERLVIFLSSHGASNGNLCYVQQNQCDFTEDVLLDTLLAYAAAKTNLKHILLVPLSCFNRIIMEAMAEKLKNYTWPFAISYILQTHTYLCSTQSVAGSLMNNMIMPFGKASNEQLDEFIALNTLEQLVDFHNRLATSTMSALEPNMHFELRKHNEALTIQLADFGFDIFLYQRLPSNIAFPSGPLASILQDLGLKERFYPYVERLEIRLANNVSKVIKINTVATTVLNEPDLAGSLVISFAVVLRKTPS